MISHLCLWLCLHLWEWPQTPWANVTIKYHPGKKMLIADVLFRYSPLIGLEVALDIATHHVHITPVKKMEFQKTIQEDPLLCTLADIIVARWPEDIKDIPIALCPYHNHHDIMRVEDGLILKGEALIIPPLEMEKILQAIHEGHMGITKCQYHIRQCAYWPGINEDIRQMVEACPTYQHYCPQESRQPLQQNPVPECPWPYLGTDFFTFDGFENLVIIDYYTKIPFIRKITPLQCNSSKTISVLKELFSEHGIPETIRSDSGPQFASHQFAKFTKEWNLDHIISSPRNPRSNGQAEAVVKIKKVSSPMPNIRAGPLPCLVGIQEHIHWSPSLIISWNALPESNTNHSASKDQAQGPPSWSWPRSPQQQCHPECYVPQLSLQAEIATVCRTNCLSTQWHQAPLAPSHNHPSSQPWLTLVIGEDSTDMHMTTSMNVTQMLLNLTYLPLLMQP